MNSKRLARHCAGVLVLCTLLVPAASCQGTVDEVSQDLEAVGGELPTLRASLDDWPWWRGPTRDGKAQGPTPPTSWSDEENVLWKVEVPGRGHATPCIVGDRIFVASADEDAETQMLLAYDRRSGKLLWRHDVHKDEFVEKHRKNSHASSTPASDGERVFTAFHVDGGIVVTAVDLDGNRLWQTPAGPFSSQNGYGASPLIHKSTVIVSADSQKAGGFLAALHRDTGKIVWRVARPGNNSYASPILAEVAGRTQLLLNGSWKTAAYDPDNGKLLWKCSGPAEVTASTIVASDRYVYSGGGHPEKELLCIRADGEGDVTDTHIVWRAQRRIPYVTSPLLHDNRLYVVDDRGVAICYAADSGETVWEQRLGGNFSASPTLVGDLLFVTNESGMTYVFKTGDKFELVAENQLGSEGFASPVICDGTLYLRTESHLYAIGEKPNETEAAE